MKWIIDRIIDNIAVIESLDDKRKMEVLVNKLPKGIHEGAVILEKDNQFILDKLEEMNRRGKIQEKFNKVLKVNNNE